MNCLIWNTRGLAKSSSRLQSLISKWKIHLLITIEPLVDCKKAHSFKLDLGFNEVIYSQTTKIWVFWDSNFINVSEVNWNPQFVHFKVSCGETKGWVTGVYGKHTVVERRDLWSALVQFSTHIKDPWMLGGDFNAFVDHDEHQGDSIPDLNSMLDFKNCIADCGLIDLPFSGNKFTWTGVRSNGRIWRRLDRVLFNEAMLDAFDDIKVNHLHKAPSDHSPLLIQLNNIVQQGPKSFKFQNMWLAHHSFLETVAKNWNGGSTGGMRGLVTKLQTLKKALRTWNKEVFGNIFDDIRKAEEEVQKAEMAYQQQSSEANREDWSYKKSLLLSKYNMERKFWKQKAHIAWLKDGDSNSHYFHSLVKIRRRKQHISSILDSDGKECLTLPDIGNAAVHFFSRLYAVESEVDTDHFLQTIPAVINEDDNRFLNKLPTETEVKDAVWDLNQNGAPGPDGFSGKFFKKCWSIVGKDVVNAVQEFFIGVPPPKGISSSFVVLIPKIDNPITFSDFRPICLSNFVNKVCTKVLATRLNKILPKIISEEQAGFMQNRDIADQVLIAQEMIHAIDKKVRGSNVVVKLDMAKAFDKLSWKYLFEILLKFGFDNQFVNLIRANLQATYLSIIINGVPQGFFQPKRGVKQGDPLSPFLFIIASEGFSRGLKIKVAEGKIKPYWMGNIGYPITHLGFADDLLIFLNGGSRSLINFNNFIKDYQTASGQTVNLQKSSFIISKNAASRATLIEDLLDMKRSDFPMKYLGVYLHKGINRAQYCLNIIKQFDEKLTPWKQKHLSQGGRLILIKHVLSSIPLHILAVDTLPKQVITILEKKMASFLWGSTNDNHRFHWVKWSKLCYPTEEGGWGIRSLIDLEKAYTLKLWWKWMTHNSLWSTFFKARYPRSTMQPKITDSPIWRRICSIDELVRELCHFNDEGRLVWDPGKEGIFTLSSAYHEVREVSSPTFTYKHLWHKSQPMKIKIFTWKLLHNCLPITDTLLRFQTVLRPSMCPLCKNYYDTPNHLFYQCSFTQGIWRYFMGIFQIPTPRAGVSVRQIFINWWLEAGSKTLADLFKHIMPGVISWHVWKVYSSYIWGSSSIPLTEQIIEQIKHYTQIWSSNIQKYKNRRIEAFLFEESLIHSNFRFKKSGLRIIKWQRPKGVYKLNVDASFIPGFAAGGAILRDRKGELIWAINFRIQAESSEEAELRAIVKASCWAIESGFADFQVESDASSSLLRLSANEGSGKWGCLIRSFVENVVRKGINFGHTLREGNWTAHALADRDYVAGSFNIFKTVDTLPGLARKYYLADLLGYPYFRL
ncbi:unnamed protein product [Cuscuta epithymum]|uniref:Reverse transcriptase domain-containing protein n=1 Tax=Cuscuta epithymum TaxID=186058 RepID=A0AAV0EM36_9ASTE|nr:unnamed protein product [Cuscuta epithymum]